MVRERDKNKEYWLVYSYNQLDADFGYDPCPSVEYMAVDKSTAKSICRHMNKVCLKRGHYFIDWFCEPELERFS